eukprot:14548266-Alexandrium_andersonii.AAC.1
MSCVACPARVRARPHSTRRVSCVVRLAPDTANTAQVSPGNALHDEGRASRAPHGRARGHTPHD